MPDRRVMVTGIGVVSPYGVGITSFWDGISSGQRCVTLLDSPEVSSLPTRFAAQIPMGDSELGQYVKNQKSLKTLSRPGRMAVIAAQEAIEHSGLDFSSLDPYRVGTSMGAGGVGLWDAGHSRKLLDTLLLSMKTDNSREIDYSKVWINILENIHPLTPLCGLSNVPTAQIAIMANARGNCHTTTTACTSSAQSIGQAMRQIRSGVADVVIAGGADSMVNPYGLVAFSMLGVLSKNNEEWQTAARPFDRRRDGFMIGEGAAVLILEEFEHCRRRGGRILAELCGYSSTNDAYRLTDEPDEAWGSITAMNNCLEDARIRPEEIDYINTHGTGTKMNDRTETFAIKQVFGDHAHKLAISSVKSMVGHLVAAAGAIEFAASVLSIENSVIPPTINFEEPDEKCDLDCVPNRAREMNLNCVMSNSFGFGGQNACLALRKYDDLS
ncbi:MAG: beta-ketoacyl-[acyl-carrier-protein] synthase family protein [candidate division Zixibacteria bacterium]|nr:beta-ketoacyl-[acyl-carrier-protein] synthase family protein [candidate division Zixibacteria bacterium]